MKTGFTLVVLCACFYSEGALTDALIDRDNGPLTGLFGFPDSREGGRLAGVGDDIWGFHVTASSHSTQDMDGQESILFDGETRRLSLGYRRAFSKRLELGVEIPWVSHESGSLDGFIDRWHSVFGLPDGIRNERPKDRLLFSYEDSARQFSVTSNTQGMGDVRLLGGWLLTQSVQSSSALRFSVKLPTGDSDRLLGSGSTDVNLGIASDGRQVLGIGKLSGFYRASATWLGTPEFGTALRTRRVVGQLSAGVGYDLTARTTLALQLLLRSPVYDSEISPLGDVAASLTIGVRFRLPREYALSFAVGEDVHPGSMPDVTFALSLQKR
jgi:hypothetical protein